MSDPIEAAWSAYAKAMDHTGPTVAEENAIRLAIAAYHAAQPSDIEAAESAVENEIDGWIYDRIADEDFSSALVKRIAHAAIAAYHAAQPSDYAELKRDARARDDETSDKLVDAIENLEAQWKQRAEAAEGALQISEAILATQIEEVAVLRARVAAFERLV